jgi:hypothetical protein
VRLIIDRGNGKIGTAFSQVSNYADYDLFGLGIEHDNLIQSLPVPLGDRQNPFPKVTT